MKLSDLLTSVLGQLRGTKQYGIPMVSLLQTQITHDPGHVIVVEDVDGRGTSVKLLAKGKQVQLDGALQSAVAQAQALGTELDVTRGGGMRFEAKGLTVTVEWRKRTATESIQDTSDRVLGKSPFEDLTFQEDDLPTYRYSPTGRLSFPALGTVDEKKARHAAHYSMGMDFSALEQRVLAQYVAGKFAEVGVTAKVVDGKIVFDLESVTLKKAPLNDPYHTTTHANCRCTIKEPSFFDDEYRFRGAKLNDVVPHWLNSRCEDVELPGEFTRARGIELPIVGNSYRSGVEQDTLRRKNVGNMVVVTREPTNASDSRALAVWAWDHTGLKTWRHVGYVPRALNAGIEEAMRKMGSSVVLVGEMLDRGSTSNPRFKVTAARRYLKAIRTMGG